MVFMKRENVMMGVPDWSQEEETCGLCRESLVEEAPHDPWMVETYCANAECANFLKGVE